MIHRKKMDIRKGKNNLVSNSPYNSFGQEGKWLMAYE